MAETQADADITLSRTSRQQARRKVRKKRIWQIVLAIVLLLIACVVAYGLHVKNKFDEFIDKIAAPEPLPSVTDSVYAPEIVNRKPDVEVTNILLLGTDNRPQFGSLNTDVIMLASLRPDTKSAIVVSIPRDTRLAPTGWNEGKANGFYASVRKKDRDRAYDYVRGIFSEFFTVPIDYVVEVDFTAFQAIVDAFGGITIDVDMDMRYYDPTDGTDINLTKGRQLLNGKQALDFVRYRQSNDGTRESSDFERNMRQQQVISALISKAKSFDSVFRIGEVLDAAGSHIKTTIPRDDIMTMIKTYIGIKQENIRFMRLEGTWKSPYVWPNTDSLQQIRDALNEHMSPIM